MVVSVLSFNVMFNDILLIERHKLIVKALLLSGADIICLQEVLHEASDFFCQGLKSLYKPVYSHIQPTNCNYGVMIFYKSSLKILDKQVLNLSSKMNRALCCANFAKDDQSFYIGTFHLESLNNSNSRQKQLAEIFSYFNNKSPLVLCGDTNLSAVEKVTLPPNIVDAALEDKTDLPTYWGSRFWDSPSKQRYDRIWYDKKLSLHNFKILFNVKINNMWLSDHDAVMATLII